MANRSEHDNKTLGPVSDNEVISVFLRDVNEIFALSGFFAAQGGSAIPTFRENLSVLSSRVRQFKNTGLLDLEDGTNILAYYA